MEKHTSLIAINKWMFFIYNYPHDFIERIWAAEPWLAAHLRGKFNGYYDANGAYGAIPSFYAELDSNNKIKMMSWVMDNYNGEQKLSFKED